MARKLFEGNAYALKDEDSGQGGPLSAVPMIKSRRFNRQINLCVEQHTHELYYRLRSLTGPHVSECLRTVVQTELERIEREFEKAEKNG